VSKGESLLAPGHAGDFNGRVVNGSYFPSAAELTMNGSAQADFHERAFAARRDHFGEQVFVRAVVEVSNFCRERCAYCGMRRDNRALHRYRVQMEQLAEVILEHRPQCVTDINLQSGEDPVVVRETVVPLVQLIRRETDLGVSVCLGTLNRELYAELRDAGASIYIMKFECADEARYAEFQAPGTLAERVEHVRLLADSGWTVSSGFIVGLPGQDEVDLLKNFTLATSLPLRGCSVSPFIPGEETPLAGAAVANANWALNCMAALRLMRPDWVIPAVSALNLAAENAYQRGLKAGANLVTINLTPSEVRRDYVIYRRDRFIMTEERILNAITAAGLTPSRRGLADHYRNGTAHVSEKPTEVLTG